jgi:hypothetical protein
MAPAAAGRVRAWDDGADPGEEFGSGGIARTERIWPDFDFDGLMKTWVQRSWNSGVGSIEVMDGTSGTASGGLTRQSVAAETASRDPRRAVPAPASLGVSGLMPLSVIWPGLASMAIASIITPANG